MARERDEEHVAIHGVVAEASDREPTIVLGARLHAWPKPVSCNRHRPGSAATHAAEADNWETAISRERGSSVAETTIVSHHPPWSVAVRAAEAAIGRAPSPVCMQIYSDMLYCNCISIS